MKKQLNDFPFGKKCRILRPPMNEKDDPIGIWVGPNMDWETGKIGEIFAAAPQIINNETYFIVQLTTPDGMQFWYPQEVLEFEDDIANNRFQVPCKCDKLTIMNRGCICGAFKAERAK